MAWLPYPCTREEHRGTRAVSSSDMLTLTETQLYTDQTLVVLLQQTSLVGQSNEPTPAACGEIVEPIPQISQGVISQCCSQVPRLPRVCCSYFCRGVFIPRIILHNAGLWACGSLEDSLGGSEALSNAAVTLQLPTARCDLPHPSVFGQQCTVLSVLVDPAASGGNAHQDTTVLGTIRRSGVGAGTLRFKCAGVHLICSDVP